MLKINHPKWYIDVAGSEGRIPPKFVSALFCCCFRKSSKIDAEAKKETNNDFHTEVFFILKIQIYILIDIIKNRIQSWKNR